MIRVDYFLAVIGVFGLMGALKVRKDLRSLVAKEPELERGGKILVRTIVILFAVVPFFQAGLTYFGGFIHDPGWWASEDIGNPFVLTDFIILSIFTLVALWWVWVANGLARFLKFRKVFPGLEKDQLLLEPRFFRWFITFCVTGFMTIRIVFLFVGHKP